MRCIDCSGKIVTVHGDLQLRDKILGDIKVPDTEYEQCQTCGKMRYTPTTLEDIESAENQRLETLLLKRPLGDFITASEVANILGCTRQALHKHKRIRRGFIHFVRHNDKIFYLKESVLQFKKTNDGRIPLAESEKDPSSEKIIQFADLVGKGKTLSKCEFDAGSATPCGIDFNDSKSKNDNLMEG